MEFIPRWSSELPTKPLDQRLIAFYEAYLPTIFRYDWVRIFVFAGLKGVGISQRYLDLIQKRVVEPVAVELRRSAGLPGQRDRPMSADELEIAWGLHGELFYLAIRRWVYDMNTPDDLVPVIRAAVVRFLEGAPAAMRALNTAFVAGQSSSVSPEPAVPRRKRGG